MIHRVIHPMIRCLIHRGTQSITRGVACFAAATVVQSAWPQLSEPVPPPKTSAQVVVDAHALDCFKSCGKTASLTILPARVAGRTMAPVGEALAMTLERAGMTELELGTNAFVPLPHASITETATAFAQFVLSKQLATDFALFTAFNTLEGTLPAPGLGSAFAEIRTIIVSNEGEIVWMDLQSKGDTAFDRIAPSEPAQCCLLVAQRMQPLLNLDDPTSAGALSGPITKRWELRTGIPDQTQLDAIAARKKIFATNAATSTLIIYPVQTNDASNEDGAMHLASLLNQNSVTRATAASRGPVFEIAANINEQKTLWTMANTFKEFVQKNPPTADYALFAHYLMGKNLLGKTSVGAVHFAICDAKGELVFVDLQNNHWPDFTKINPKSREACDDLVFKRISDVCE